MHFKGWKLTDWAMFIAAVFVAGVAINTVAKRFPAVAQVGQGL